MKTKVDRKQQLNMLDATFWRLARCCESAHEWDKYVALNEQEEKAHRRFKPDHVECGLTKAQAVRYFAVKEVFERFGMPNVCRCGWQGANSICPECGKVASQQKVFTPTAEEVFRIRHSVFAACTIAKLCADKIWAEFDRLEMIEWLATVDYVELNKDQRQLAEVAA
jgi:hypothetical protein